MALHGLHCPILALPRHHSRSPRGGHESRGQPAHCSHYLAQPSPRRRVPHVHSRRSKHRRILSHMKSMAHCLCDLGEPIRNSSRPQHSSRAQRAVLLHVRLDPVLAVIPKLHRRQVRPACCRDDYERQVRLFGAGIHGLDFAPVHSNLPSASTPTEHALKQWWQQWRRPPELMAWRGWRRRWLSVRRRLCAAWQHSARHCMVGRTNWLWYLGQCAYATWFYASWFPSCVRHLPGLLSWAPSFARPPAAQLS